MIFEHKKLERGLPWTFLVFGAIFALFVLQVGVANAGTTSTGPFFAVAPHTFELSVEKGTQHQDKIKVYNRGNFAIPFQIKVIDFDAIDETGEMEAFEMALSDEDSAVSWFKFSDDSFTVEAQEKTNIDFEIDIPGDAKSQGYYAVVMFEADISTLVLNESKVQIIPNMGVLFMLNVDKQNQSAEELEILEYGVIGEDRYLGVEKIVDFLSGPLRDDDSGLNIAKTEEPTFLVKIKNNSAYHKKIAGKINLTGVGWKLGDQFDFPEITILPGRSRSVLVKGASVETDGAENVQKESESRDENGFGFLNADLNIKTQEGLEKNKKRWIFVFSWQLIIVAVVLIAVIYLLQKLLSSKTHCVKRKSRKIKKREINKK